MSKSNNTRPSASNLDRYGRRQPRPNPRRQGTRHGIVLAATKEG